MSFCADLHIHSKYSRATSQACDLEHLSAWARTKGLAVIATGDVTHPAWGAELREKLIPAEPGLFRLRPGIERAVTEAAFVPDSPPTRFMLSAEVACIYKKDDRTRKAHHVVYVPGFAEAERLAERLSAIGNLAADGRPILKLDSRDLLEIVLEVGHGSFLVPAHIWTPWFSMLGAKSGFDSVEECFGDLARHVFALETGLSSDPAMNRRLSSLDRYTLVSNSDAHSPGNLGREACVFDGEMSFPAVRQALETGDTYGGTIEFFPEEGKYHLDGHRNCGVRLTPAETRRNEGRCPVCGKPVTVGVMHRVEGLADRARPPDRKSALSFDSLIPLAEILAEIEGVGSKTRRVMKRYRALTAAIGPELFILREAALDDVQQEGGEVFAEALRRMRRGDVVREPGFDGKYGVIRLFKPGELPSKEPAGL